jgi:hypothetical protein
MTPRQFFDEVAEPNAQLAIANGGDPRLWIDVVARMVRWAA